MSSRFTMVVAVHLLLLKESDVLLARRFNTGYEDGNFSVPAGHVEENESCLDAMVREAKEEIGIMVAIKDLMLVHVMHRKTNRESIDFFFTCRKWKGNPNIKEKDKCDSIDWYNIDSLPANIIGYIQQAISGLKKKESYSQFGW